MNPREETFRIIDAAVAAAGKRSVGVLLLRTARYHQYTAFLGYAAADALALAVERVLTDVFRVGGRVFALGDCDFMVLLPNLVSISHAGLAANRALRVFDEPFVLEGRPIMVAVAAGLAVSPDHGSTAETLCRQAERALIDAGRRGASLSIAGSGHDEVALYEDLRRALGENALEVNFQPVYALDRQRIVGVESLARWTCPRRGAVSPGLFIALAEETGLIPELTHWSLHASLREFSALHALDPTLHCAINLSPKLFPHSGLVEEIMDAASLWGVAPDQVVLEVTESAMMESPERGAAVLCRLVDAGFQIAIDDFGKGYSSFSYLKQFPASELKIDRSFTADVTRDRRSEHLVRSMVDLAHHLDMHALAEGVEDQATLEVLQSIGCDRAQGFHLARPMPVAAVVARVQEQGAAVTPLREVS